MIENKGDLISREALLKRVDEEREYLKARGQLGAEHILVHNFRDLIDNAPTEKLTFSLDNISDEDIETFKSIWQRATSKGLLLVNERPQGEWIPISEGFPKIGEFVLCQCQANIFDVFKWTKEGWYKDANRCYMPTFVIAWQPLPEPYKKEGEEE